MVRLIGLTGALDLAKRLVDENEGNLKNPENYINHIRCGEIAMDDIFSM